MRILLTLILTISLFSCTTGTTNIHGSLIKPADVDKLKLGIHSKQDVQYILGSPSTVSTLDNNQWYYITDITEKKPLSKPGLKTRALISIKFAKDGKIDHIAEIDESKSKTFNPDQNTTKTQGSKMGYMDQIWMSLTSGIKSLN